MDEHSGRDDEHYWALRATDYLNQIIDLRCQLTRQTQEAARLEKERDEALKRAEEFKEAATKWTRFMEASDR